MLNRNAFLTRRALHTFAKAFVRRVYGEEERIRFTGLPTCEDKARNPEKAFREPWQETTECRVKYLRALREDAQKWNNDEAFDLSSYENKSVNHKHFEGEIPLQNERKEASKSIVVYTVKASEHDYHMFQESFALCHAFCKAVTDNTKNPLIVQKKRVKIACGK